MPPDTASLAIRHGKIAVLTFWGYFLVWLLLPMGRQKLITLLHPDLWWLVMVGATVMAAFVFIAIFQKSPGKLSPLKKLHAIPQLLILLLPLLYFSLAAEANLGIDALKKRSASNSLANNSIGLATGQEFMADEDAPQIDGPAISLQTLLLSPKAAIGRKVNMETMVFFDESMPENLFYGFRFMINCCAADAMPLGTFVRWRQAKKLAVGSWVKVEGTVKRSPDNKAGGIFIEATAVTPTKKPDSPYLF